MARAFEFTGTTDEKFKQLEQIIQRLGRKQGKRVLTLPPSIISCEVLDLAIPFKCLLFAGKVEKICYSFSSVIKEGKVSELNLKCLLQSGSELRSVDITGKKLKGLITLGLEVKDGDILTLQNNDPGIKYLDPLISILFTPQFTSTKLIPVEVKDEGI